MQEPIFIQHIDMSQTKWFGSLSGMFYLIENPAFLFKQDSPYRCSMTIAIYCRKGHAVGKVNIAEYELSSDGFLIVLPNQIIESTYVSNDFEGTYILMSAQFLDNLNIREAFQVHNSVEHAPYIQLGERAKEALMTYIAMSKSVISVEENPNRLEILRLITKAFFLGFGYFMHKSAQQELCKSHGSWMMMKFLGLVERHYREYRDLDFYANKMGITSKHLSKVIKNHSGKKALQWIEHYVILDAKSQLASTDKSVKHISYELNFPSQSFFGKYFCRVTGMSPIEYRKSIRENS